MAMNGENNVEEADMSECDEEKVVTMMDVLQEQQEFEEDANAVLGASDDMNCTYPKGYIKRQALYACLTCCTEARHDESKQAGVCLACSLNCHENHDLIELYTKRNFRCDCGNPKFDSHPCQFTPNKTELNTDNKYNQNFSGIYCVCRRPYPDPEAKDEEEMIQCIVCEDWLHTTHLEATVPSNDQYSEMVCQACMEKNEFLHDYSHLAVNNEIGDIDIGNVNGNDSNCNGKVDGNLTNGDITNETKANDMETESNLATNDTENTTADNEEETNTEKSPKTDQTNDDTEKMDTEDTETSEKVNQEESETNNVPVTENTEQVAIETTESTAETVKENADTVSESKTNSIVDSNMEENKSEENKEENSEVDLKTQENLFETIEKESVNPDTTESDDRADANEVADKNDTNDNGTKEEPDSTGTSEDKPNDTPAESHEKTAEVMDTTENEVDEASTDEVKTSDNIEGNTEAQENKESADESKESAEETKPSVEESKESAEENKESVGENEESADDNKESVEESKESAEETKQSAEESKESAEENKESAEENKESVRENEESADDNKESVEENIESADENKESVEENKESETVETETKPDSIETDNNQTSCPTTSTEEQNSTYNDTNGPLNTSNNLDEAKDSTEVPTQPEKRKLTDENDESHSKKQKLDSTCIRPKNVKRIHKGATFWPSHFRQKLCTCNECIAMYKDLSVLFLTDPEDTVSAYEMLGKERNNGEPSTQYEKGLKALSSLNRVQQINALTEYNKMRDKLLDFLKSFKDKKEVVKEEDIRAFFAGMKPKREPDGVYFCR